MIIKLFDLKREMLATGEYIIDLIDNNFEVNYYDPNLVVQKLAIIREEHLCNPFLFCKDMYGDANYVDVIIKFNQITNPFSMNLNDILVIPDLDSVARFYRQSSKSPSVALDTKSLYLNPDRASKRDTARLEQLKKIASKRKNGSKEIKPTNLLRDGEVPFSTDGVVLRFAPSISKPRFPTNF